MSRPAEDLYLLRRAFESSPSGIIVGLSALPDMPVIYVNPAVEEITGVPAAEMTGRNVCSLFGNGAKARLCARIERVLRGSGGKQVFVLPDRRPDGRSVWVKVSLSSVSDRRGKITNFVAILDDITDHKLVEEKLSHRAVHDSLTGLPGRAIINDLLSQAISSHLRRKKKLCVAFVDLDRFKIVNDTLGHASGDLLLKEVAARFRQRLRSSDIVARLGGDEFIIILSDINNPAEVRALPEKVLDYFADPFILDGHEVAVSASLGLTLCPDDGDTPDELLRNADRAMYQAKSQGRKTCCIYSAGQKHSGEASTGESTL